MNNMEYGYVTDNPKYNKTSGLYDVPIMIGEDIKTISSYRILNPTILKYTLEPGYFLISPDSKFIYINDKTDINILIKYIIFSKNNLNYSNQDLLEINSDPIRKYNKISLIEIPKEYCINLSLEDNDSDRKYQIATSNLYNNYDCLVKNISNISFTNNESKKLGMFETMSYFINGSPSINKNDKEDHPDCNVTVTSIMEDVNQYNNYYVYGLTTLNCLFIIIIIIMVFNIIQDSKKRQLPRRSNIDF
jgi:hypothetical protein